MLADSVGLALLVVLDTLTPAERLAFVLHDMFAVPFDEIAPIVEPLARRRPASWPAGPAAGCRARRRSRTRDLAGSAEVVDAFLAASRGGDFDALLAVLDPDVVLRADTAAAQMGADARGASARARWRTSSPGGPGRCGPRSSTALPGAVWTQRGETRVVFAFTITGGTITAIEQIADPERIARLEVIPLKAGLRTRQAQRGQLAGSSGIALARTTLA